MGSGPGPRNKARSGRPDRSNRGMSSTHPWIALTASALVVASTFTISLVVDTRQATETPPLNHEKLSPRTDHADHICIWEEVTRWSDKPPLLA